MKLHGSRGYGLTDLESSAFGRQQALLPALQAHRSGLAGNGAQAFAYQAFTPEWLRTASCTRMSFG